MSLWPAVALILGGAFALSFRDVFKLYLSHRERWFVSTKAEDKLTALSDRVTALENRAGANRR